MYDIFVDGQGIETLPFLGRARALTLLGREPPAEDELRLSYTEADRQTNTHTHTHPREPQRALDKAPEELGAELSERA